MAERPVFLPRTDRPGVRTITVAFQWHPGFARVQKQRCVEDLHSSVRTMGVRAPLEISGASETPLGRQLSAFSLSVCHPIAGHVPLECAFQAGKVFARGGPFSDLLDARPGEARRDPRLRRSGELIHFVFGDLVVPSEPVTLYYDWLYLGALDSIPAETRDALERHDGFTDIHFNPQRSLNCQASAAALYLSLRSCGVERPGTLEPEELAALLDPHERAPKQGSLFGLKPTIPK
jgi:hypothetical protein